jgi:hypothetical protein
VTLTVGDKKSKIIFVSCIASSSATKIDDVLGTSYSTSREVMKPIFTKFIFLFFQLRIVLNFHFGGSRFNLRRSCRRVRLLQAPGFIYQIQRHNLRPSLSLSLSHTFLFDSLNISLQVWCMAQDQGYRTMKKTPNSPRIYNYYEMGDSEKFSVTTINAFPLVTITHLEPGTNDVIPLLYPELIHRIIF